MKKVLLSVIMSVLFLAGSLSMISMTPPPPENTLCTKFLKEDPWVLEYYGITKGQYLGGCNVCLNNAESAGNNAVCMCKVIDTFEGGLGDVGFGECVNIFKSFDDAP